MIERSKLWVPVIVLSALASVASAQADEQSRSEQQAQVLFQRAVAHYESGEFERAAVMLEEAIALHDIAVLHHNLGRALQEMGRWAEARAEYALYLEREPDSPQRSRVEARMAQIDERIDELERIDAPTDSARRAPTDSAQPAPRAQEAHSPSPAPWVVLAVGAASLAAAIPFAVLFDDAVTNARAAADHRAAAGPAADAEVYAITADTLLIAGGVLALGGVVWGLVDISAGNETVDVALGPTGVMARGAF